MKLPSIHSQALKVILLPLTGLSFALCASLIYLNISYTDKFVQQYGNAQIKQWALMVEQIGIDNKEQISDLFDAARVEPSIRALAIYTDNNNEHLHLGPVFETHIPSIAKQSLALIDKNQATQFSQSQSGQTLLFKAAFSDGSSLYLELSKLPYLLLDYQTLLSGMLLWLLCTAIAAALTTHCSRSLVNALRQICANINQISAGSLTTDSDNSADQLHNQELNEIMQSIEQMRHALQQTQQDNQYHSDQSTNDLRETLDTIEVQNIELNIARKEALKASRIKSEFLANTSHEFRTPLNGIIGFAQLALRTDLSEQQQNYLRTILESSQNLLTSINDILDFSKLETGQLALDYMPLNPRNCIEETLKILAPEAQQKKLELITLFDPELPQQLLGDPLRLKQILSNLIGNGIKFSARGNIIIRVQQLQTLDTQVEIKISISDSGIGLTIEQQQELFSPFSQADTSNSREHGGAGLGLSISKGLIERMDGQIGVDSKVGQGSTFWFQLKLGIDRSHNQNNNQNKLSLTGQRALIFSRNSMATLQLQDLLENWDVNCEQQSSIEQLLPTISEANQSGKPYNLLLLDSSYDFNNDDYQQLKKVIWRASQRYQCRIVTIASSEQLSLIVDTTLHKLIRNCLKPLICQDLQVHIEHKNSKAQNSVAIIAASPQQKAPYEGEPKARSAQVLVVDDNPANLQLASELLKGIGAKVTTANNGSEALQLCAQHDYDLIFMDVQMPILDGMNTTRELRKREDSKRRTPIIALTAHAMSDQKTDLLLAGMDDYLHKPVSESQLQHALHRWSQHNIDISVNKSTEVQETFNKANSNIVVDREKCLALANYKADLARDMLSMLIDTAKQDIELLPHLYREQKFDELSERIHKLYGSCCYSGVPALKKISGKLDKLLQQKQYANLEQDLIALGNAIAALLNWNQEFDVNALFGFEN
jgi:two-component system sensor histidine kinase BarA